MGLSAQSPPLITVLFSRLLEMATKSHELLNLQDQDVVNFQNDDTFVTDSDADNDDDRPHFQKVKEESLRRRKVMLQHWDK
jgi:hypothetical protein